MKLCVLFRNWINGDKDNILKELNKVIFKEDWDKYAQGTISAWERKGKFQHYRGTRLFFH